ncbi:MAG TPA: glycosyltransferase family 4 protein [Candidatus Polarisedimenticolia bacterium]|nr:glycosyltransferase family 4 protein [Candidatus Polarisedimenticolia bacterium]
MRIAQVAPLHESVPPKAYGGTERVVSYLTEELVRRGHRVTLFASGDSVTRAELAAICPKALRLNGSLDPLAHHVAQIEQVMRRRGDFDVIHWHTDYLHYPFSRLAGLSQLTTLHGRLDIPDLAPLYRLFPDMPLVSISQAQRAPLPWVRWMATVHHGLPRDLYTPRRRQGRYLAFLGRLSPEKRVERAIALARRAGMPIRIAAKIDEENKEYFEARVKPLLEQDHVEYVGEIGEAAKDGFLGQALALLFPIEWPEPFGLVMVESLACGTPVIAFRRGSVPEVIEDGVTGFIVETMEEALGALGRVRLLDRGRCRLAFEERFCVERMAGDYLALYERLAARGRGAAVAAAAGP